MLMHACTIDALNTFLLIKHQNAIKLEKLRS